MKVDTLQFINEEKRLALGWITSITTALSIKRNYISLTRNQLSKLEWITALPKILQKERWSCLPPDINTKIILYLSSLLVQYYWSYFNTIFKGNMLVIYCSVTNHLNTCRPNQQTVQQLLRIRNLEAAAGYSASGYAMEFWSACQPDLQPLGHSWGSRSGSQMAHSHGFWQKASVCSHTGLSIGLLKCLYTGQLVSFRVSYLGGSKPGASRS